MASQNDVTGDLIKTKPTSDAYRSNWGAIFGKKNPPCYNESSPVEPDADGVGTSGKERCGQAKAV